MNFTWLKNYSALSLWTRRHGCCLLQMILSAFLFLCKKNVWMQFYYQQSQPNLRATNGLDTTLEFPEGVKKTIKDKKNDNCFSLFRNLNVLRKEWVWRSITVWNFTSSFRLYIIQNDDSTYVLHTKHFVLLTGGTSPGSTELCRQSWK